MSTVSTRPFGSRASGTLGRILLGNLDPATCLTLLSVALSVVAVACIAAGNLAVGVICFMYAGLCDLFDGFIARRSTRTAQQQAFGLQIDSIADMAAFGVVPAFMGLQLGLTSPFDVAALIFYVCCAAMRLAHFNVHGTTNHGSQRFYTGVPVTYAALIFPILLLVATAEDRPSILWLIQGYFWGLGTLFVLRLRIPKPGGIYYVIFPLIAVVLTIFWGLRL